MEPLYYALGLILVMMASGALFILSDRKITKAKALRERADIPIEHLERLLADLERQHHEAGERPLAREPNGDASQLNKVVDAVKRLHSEHLKTSEQIRELATRISVIEETPYLNAAVNRRRA